MPFSDDLVRIFRANTDGAGAARDEVFLFRALVKSVHDAAVRNGHAAHLVEIHKSYVHYPQTTGIPFYYAKDSGKEPACELADVMFVVYNRREARLCFMQNKYDKRLGRFRNFKADTRQFYLLRHRPPYWKGRCHGAADPAEHILQDARYSSVTNYGVFAYVAGAAPRHGHFEMEYYNAEAIDPPAGVGRHCVLSFNATFRQYTTVDDPDDQLNYAFNLEAFGQGLMEMKIGEKYEHLNDLLQAVNIQTVIDHFRMQDRTNIQYDPNRPSILARCIVLLNADQYNRIG